MFGCGFDISAMFAEEFKVTLLIATPSAQGLGWIAVTAKTSEINKMITLTFVNNFFIFLFIFAFSQDTSTIVMICAIVSDPVNIKAMRTAKKVVRVIMIPVLKAPKVLSILVPSFLFKSLVVRSMSVSTE